MSSHLKKSKNSLLFMALILFLVTSLVGALLAILHQCTAPVVIQSANERIDSALRESFADAVEFKSVVEYPKSVHLGADDIQVKSVYSAWDVRGQLIGYCVNTAPKGYVDEIDMMVAVDRDGYILDTVILSISESPGIGLKVQTNEEFRNSLKNINDTVKGVRSKTTAKDEVRIISGATASSKAYIDGVNAAIEVVQLLRAEEVLR